MEPDEDPAASGTRDRSATVWLVALVLVVVAVPAATVLWLTSAGIGATPDGTVYLGVAANLTDGEGLTSPVASFVDSIPPADAARLYGRTPLVRWPPGYPLVLAAGSALLGDDPSAAARALAVVAVAANAALTLLIGRRWTGSTLVGAGCALLVVTESDHLLLHSLVSSEPLYLTATLGCVLAADRWVREGTVAALAVAAGAAGVAWLVRFSGVAVVAALAVTVLVVSRRRVRDLAVVAAAALPAVAWILHTESSPYREAHREIRSLPWSEVESMFDTVQRWILSDAASSTTRWFVCAGVFAAVIGGIVVLGRRALLPATTIVAHTAVVVVSVVAVRKLPVGDRMLMPLQPLVICLAATGVVGAIRLLTARWPAPRRVPVAAGGVVALGAVLVALALWHQAVAVDSLEPARMPDAQPELLARLDGLPADTVVFSNDATAFYLVSERPAVSVPARRWQESEAVNEGFDDELADLVDLVREGRAVVVLYPGAAFFNDDLVTAAELDVAGIDQVEVDGAVLVTAAGPPT